MANEKDEIGIELFIDEKKASLVLDNFEKKAVDTINKVETAGKNAKFGREMEQDLAGAVARVQDLRVQLQNTATVASQTGAPIWRSYVTGAQQAADRARILYGQLKQLQVEASRTTDPTLFRSIQNQARSTEAQITALEVKMQRVVAGRSAIAARGGAGATTGLAQSGAVQSAAQGLLTGAGVPAEAASLIPASALLSAGVAAAAGVVIIKWSEQVKKEAEQRYALEEKIQGIYNKQALALKAISDADRDFQTQRAQAAEGRQLNQRIAGAAGNSGDLAFIQEQLQADIALAERRRYIDSIYGKGGDDPKAIEADIAQKRAAILKIDEEIQKAQKTGFTDSDSGKYPIFERMRKSLEDENEKFKKEVDKARDLVSSYKKEVTDLTQGIFAERGSDNPFVKVFTDADEAIRRTTESTRGLSKELQGSLIGFTQQNNAIAFAKARVDSLISSFSLRAEAENFRNPLDPDKIKEQEERFIRRFLGDNPNFIFLKEQEFDARRADSRDPLSLGQASFDDFIRKDILKRSEGLIETPRSRLNKQLSEQFDLLFKPGISPDEQAIADRKFSSLARGANPLDLDDSNRRAAAEALERQAVREDKQIADAQRERLAQTKIQGAMLKQLEALNRRAGTEGKSAVEVLVKDGTEDGLSVRTERSPRPSDTAAAYEFDGFGINGGSNR